MVATLGEVKRVVTGNRLHDGVPIYFTGNGRWSRSIAEAHPAAPEDGDRLLAEAQASARPGAIIAPYLIDVIVGSGGIAPASLREQIRASGPTTRRADTCRSAA